MLARIFIGYLTILPFIVLNWGYEGPKLAYYFTGSFILTIFWIYKILRNPGKIDLTRVDGFYFLWLLILTIASVFGVHPVDSIIGGSYRHQGVIFFLGFWLIGKTVAILDENQKKLLKKAISVIVLAQAIIVIVQFISGHLYFGKPLGTLGEANAVSGFLAIGSFFVFETFPKITLLFPAVAVIFCQSRSAAVAIIPLIFKVKKIYWVIFTPLLIVIIFFVSLGRGGAHFENRPVIWEYGINKIFQKPILGYGAESGEVVYDTAFYEKGFSLQNLTIDRTHNLFLDVAMWSGIAGLMVFIVWLFLGFRGIKDINKKLAFISFLIFAMLQPLGVTHWVLLAVILNIEVLDGRGAVKQSG